MVRETAVSVNDLIYPLFLVDGKQIADPILSLPGQNRWSLDMLLPELESCVKLGINSFVLFPGLDDSLKDADASYSYNDRNFYLKAISAIKKEFPDSCLISDVAMEVAQPTI